jgi:endonuclease/exonuclease/phosphatase (EEP) superfamily protein YafD
VFRCEYRSLPRPSTLRLFLHWPLSALLLATLAGELGRFHWILDLFVHFKLQYAVCLAVAALIALVVRRPLLAAIAIAACAFNAWSVLAFAYAPAPTQATRDFRLVSFNAAFWNDNYAEIGTFLEHSGADAVVVLEYSNEQIDGLRRHLPSFEYASTGPADLRFGAAVLSRWPLARAETIELTSGGAAAAFAQAQFQEHLVSIYGVHLNWPASSTSAPLRNAELERLGQILAGCEGACVVAGDFNVTPWSHHYRRFEQRSGWQNCARGQGIVATWPDPVLPLGIPIDHCLASSDMSVAAFATGPAMGSDHFPIIIDFELR